MGIRNFLKNRKNNIKEFGKNVINYKELSENIYFVKDSINKLNPKNKIKNSRTETFEEAKKRLNLTDEDINKTNKNFVYMFYISLFFAIILFSLSVYFLFSEKLIIKSLATISIMLVACANMFKFSFRSYQIRKQNLCDVKIWWNDSNEWIPKKIKMEE